ncbi:energy transducer TonB [Noviherbaspirillum galbum]|uniref:TonB family protein n=1 Tax=Noviherbaspirillum galbum TaxID=2709383 RepID=A0A6B3SMA4_9BURK|nr:energy transducer TonB [Noviherbaspirillum galbum]NEX59826.1 TonB family protein [Noviherbaspirillum galbum]
MASGPQPTVITTSIKRLAPLAIILFLHGAVLYALRTSLPAETARRVPREVIASFITQESPRPSSLSVPAPAPVKSQPVNPATVRNSAPAAQPALLNKTPSPKAIVQPEALSAQPAPPAPPAPATPAAPSAASGTAIDNRAANAAASPSASAYSTPSAPSAPAQPKTVSSGIEYIQPPRPEYPNGARRLGEEGKVMLRVLVNERGVAERIEIQKSSGSPRLDEAARQAVLRAVFKPYAEDGKPVPMYALVPIAFQLD